MRRMLTSFLLIFLLCVFPLPAVRADTPEAQDAANSWRFTAGAPALLFSEGAEASHPDASLRGIDVSHHQDVIDWDAVKASGIDFAILRCGFGMDQTDQDDRQFLHNAMECERLEIPYGVYLYSYATNTQRAQSEAEHVLRLINGRRLSYPVYFDMEDNSTLDCDLPAIATTFCQQITAAGYPVGVYSSVYWWKHYLTDPCFDQWYRWVAHYNTECGYTGDFQIWQYSSKGRIDGIETNVDLNFQIGYPEDHGTATYYHTYTQEVTVPTCTEGGYSVFTCEDCGNRYTACRKDPIPHPWDSGTVIRESTCTLPGSAYYLCTGCDAEKEEPLPLVNHNFRNMTCTYCGTNGLNRISGSNRYQTAYAVAEQLKISLGRAKFPAMVVASGQSFPDALSGTYLASQKQAPILLVNSKNSDSIAQLRAYVAGNLETGGIVYLLGGTSAISEEVETALYGFQTRRLSGSNRYGTNLSILAETGPGDGEILICTGRDFPDSLSASAVNKPILLLGPQGLTPDQQVFLENSARKFVLIGGANAVSLETEILLGEIGTVERIAGSNRYQTALAVANRFFPDASTLVLASARTFPDGLCGGPLASSLQAPLILTAPNAEPVAANYLQDRTLHRALVLGGENALSQQTVSRIFG